MPSILDWAIPETVETYYDAEVIEDKAKTLTPERFKSSSFEWPDPERFKAYMKKTCSVCSILNTPFCSRCNNLLLPSSLIKKRKNKDRIKNWSHLKRKEARKEWNKNVIKDLDYFFSS